MGQIVGGIILGMLKTVLGELVKYYVIKKKIAEDSKKKALEEQLEAQKEAGATQAEIAAAQDKVLEEAKKIDDIDAMLDALRRFRPDN